MNMSSVETVHSMGHNAVFLLMHIHAMQIDASQGPAHDCTYMMMLDTGCFRKRNASSINHSSWPELPDVSDLKSYTCCSTAPDPLDAHIVPTSDA